MSSHDIVMAAAGAAPSPPANWDITGFADTSDKFISSNPYVTFVREVTFPTTTSRFLNVSVNGLYMLWADGNTLHEHIASTAYSFSGTASTANPLAVGAPIKGAIFNGNGTVLIVITSTDARQYSLSTAYAITTASLTGTSATFSGAVLNSTVSLPLIGTAAGFKGFSIDSSTGQVYEIILGGSYTAVGTTVTSLSKPISGYSLSLSIDGKLAYVRHASAPYGRIYNVTTAFDLSALDTTTYKQWAVDPTGTSSNTVFFSSLDLAFVQTSSTKLQTYTSTSRANISAITGLTSVNIATSGIKFKPDGTKLYFLNITNDTIYSFNLATAWDLRTATLGPVRSITVNESSPTSFDISTDGLKLFVTGTFNDSVIQFTLATAWDVSTSIPAGSKVTGVINPGTLWFSPDGAHMYQGITTVWSHFTLSTPWDVTTAVLSDTYTLSSAVTMRGITMKDDGTSIVVANPSLDTVSIYTLTTPYVISSTVPSTGVPTSPEAGAAGSVFSTDLTKLFITGSTLDNILTFLKL